MPDQVTISWSMLGTFLSGLSLLLISFVLAKLWSLRDEVSRIGQSLLDTNRRVARIEAQLLKHRVMDVEEE